MITAIPISEIESLVIKQLNTLFVTNEDDNALIINEINRCGGGGGVIERLEKCFKPNPNKYYSRDGETYFNPFHSGQYNIFLYFLSNNVWKAGNTRLADKIYYLNKVLNSDDLFYEVELPEYFSLDHPMGSVIGRGQYGDGFTFLQGCTVGNNKGIYPVIGKNVKMCGNSSIIGNCHIGNNVTLGFGAVVKDEDVPDDCLVFG